MPDIERSCVRCTWAFRFTEGKYLLPLGPHTNFPPALLGVTHATGAATEDLSKTPKISVLTVARNRANNDLYNIIMMVIYIKYEIR